MHASGLAPLRLLQQIDLAIDDASVACFGRDPVAPDWSRGYEVAQLLVVTALLALLLPRLRAAGAITATLALSAALVYAGITGSGHVAEGARRRSLARLFGI